MLRKSLLASVVLGLLLAANGDAREWTDNTGVFTVEAALLGVSDGSVRLGTKNGIVVQVPVERLCRADQLFLRSIRQVAKPEINEALVAIDKTLQTKMSFEFTDAPLEDVVRYVSERNEIDVEIDGRALDNQGMGVDDPVTFRKENVVLAEALDLMLKPLKMTWVVCDDVLLITTPEEAEAEMETRVYIPSKGQQLDALIADITKKVQPQRWSDVGGPGAICKISTGVLIIRQTYQCHREIEGRYKDALRAIRPTNMAVPSSVLPDPVATALNLTTPIIFFEVPLEDAMHFLSKTSGAKVSFDKKALADVGIGLDVPMTRVLKRVRFRSVLRLMLKNLELTWYPDEAGIVITTPEQAVDHMQSVQYGARGFTRYASLGDLIGAIKATVTPQMWDNVGGPASIKRGDGYIIDVRTTWDAHAAIEQLMQDLRQALN